MKSIYALAASLVAVVAPVVGCMAEPDEQESFTSFEEALDVANVQCNARPLEVIVKGRENRFGLDGQQVALNPAIPIDRICRDVAASCNQLCASAKAEAVASGVKGFQDSDPVKLRQMGLLADTFNGRLGLRTNFRQLGAAPADGNNANNGAGAGAGAAVQCNAKLLQVVVQGKEHRFGFDNRQVALNPAIPMQNICQQVSAGCRATCDTAKAAAEATGIKGFSGDFDAGKLRSMGQLADDFNAALGNQSNFKNNFINLN